jgi:DNA-binding transcriptional regulator PaaX
MSDFLEAFLAAGYGASMFKLDSEYRKVKNKTIFSQIEKQKRRQIEKYIYKLKRDGLIEFSSGKKIKLSKKGAEKFESLNSNDFFNKNSYAKEDGERLIIVSYDLPIRFNKQRDKLREILKILGFRMIHKSVWVGKVKIPIRLINGLDKLHLLPYIEILEVTKQGSLKPI